SHPDARGVRRPRPFLVLQAGRAGHRAAPVGQRRSVGHMTEKTYRVVQWATGSIGQIGIRHFVDNPTFELAGVYVTTDAKAGMDAGELAGIPPCGVTATTDIEEILGLGADCVHYSPLHADV